MLKMNTEKGWKDGEKDFDFLDIYQCCINAHLIYGETKIVLECDVHPATIRYGDEHGLCNGEIIGTYNTEEEFYNAIIFEKPLQQIVDESHFEYWS